MGKWSLRRPDLGKRARRMESGDGLRSSRQGGQGGWLDAFVRVRAVFWVRVHVYIQDKCPQSFVGAVCKDTSSVWRPLEN